MNNQEPIKNIDDLYDRRFSHIEQFMGKGGFVMEQDVFELVLKNSDIDDYGNLVQAGSVVGKVSGEPRYSGKIFKGMNRKQRRAERATKKEVVKKISEPRGNIGPKGDVGLAGEGYRKAPDPDR